ncbi:MAG: DUF4168 domain-containing protein [Gammaproteobacteria bacterium]
MNKRIKAFALPAGLIILLGAPLTIVAQQQQEEGHPTGKQGMPSEAPTAAAELDAETKEKFVTAYVDIQQIQVKYTEQLQQADDEAKAREIQEKAQNEMVQAVEGSGMSVTEYNEVVAVISSDPDLRMEIEEKAKQAQ